MFFPKKSVRLFFFFQLVLTCSGCAEFLKLFENVIGSFELSGLVQFVASCYRLLQLVVCSCRLFRLFRLFQAVSSWFRLFEKVLGCLGRPGCSACSKLFSAVKRSLNIKNNPKHPTRTKKDIKNTFHRGQTIDSNLIHVKQREQPYPQSRINNIAS